MPFGPDDVKTSEFLDPFSEDNVSTAASHVGRYGHMSFLPCHGHNFGLPFVILGVQNLVLDPGFGQHFIQFFRLIYGDGPHEHGLSLLMKLLDFLDCGLEFFSFSLVNSIWIVEPNHRFIGWDYDDIQVIDFLEFRGLGVSSTGHAG